VVDKVVSLSDSYIGDAVVVTGRLEEVAGRLEDVTGPLEEVVEVFEGAVFGVR
jgi:hypothetical protein